MRRFRSECQGYWIAKQWQGPGCTGFGVWGLGFRVWGLGLKVLMVSHVHLLQMLSERGGRRISFAD